MVYRWLIALLTMAMSASGESLKPIALIDLPGPKGQRFDYLTMDAEDHYLLSAHLGPGLLYVIDVRTNKLVKAIHGMPGITGLEYVPGLHKVYTSNWGEEKIGVVDLRTMSVVKRPPTESKPNGMAYAGPFRKVYVVNTVGKAVSVIDVHKDEIVKILRFDSETGTPAYEAIAHISVPPGGDVVKFDAGNGRAYAACSRGTISIVQEDDPEHFRKVEDFPVQKLVHSLAVDPSTHRVYASEQQEDGQPVARIVVYEANNK